ncbi:hypothetical protein GGP90_001420 [Salinibacter ruber]|nr:hypothetical protein [Salinibacter ruber]MCS3756650.1 hypothetical protein [Salinibacter ruber]MCS3953800.1 hypothetical protein [Salinibacter ruber]MCS4087277.1 hypothetical protein [Salinibacter ruber]
MGPSEPPRAVTAVREWHMSPPAWCNALQGGLLRDTEAVFTAKIVDGALPVQQERASEPHCGYTGMLPSPVQVATLPRPTPSCGEDQTPHEGRQGVTGHRSSRRGLCVRPSHCALLLTHITAWLRGRTGCLRHIFLRPVLPATVPSSGRAWGKKRADWLFGASRGRPPSGPLLHCAAKSTYKRLPFSPRPTASRPVRESRPSRLP